MPSDGLQRLTLAGTEPGMPIASLRGLPSMLTDTMSLPFSGSLPMSIVFPFSCFICEMLLEFLITKRCNPLNGLVYYLFDSLINFLP